MQEIHSQPEDEVKWRKEWGSKIYLNHGSSNSRGTMIGFSKNLDIQNLSYHKDNEGRIQTCSFTHNDKKYLIINVYNANIESEQVKTLETLSSMIENCDPLESEIIIGGDFNFIFDKKLDALGGNPSLKLNSISEVTKIINKFDLCDIFRIRNPEKKLYTFRKPTPRLFRRLDFFLCSNMLKDNVLKTEILASIDSDHSPIVLKIGEMDPENRGSSLWKFPSTLSQDLIYVNEIKEGIEKYILILNELM